MNTCTILILELNSCYVYDIILNGVIILENNPKNIVKCFCISAFKIGVSILIFIITITSILSLFGASININTQDLIGLNILDVAISKESLYVSIKPLGMLSIFIIGGAIGTFENIKKYNY